MCRFTPCINDTQTNLYSVLHFPCHPRTGMYSLLAVAVGVVVGTSSDDSWIVKQSNIVSSNEATKPTVWIASKQCNSVSSVYIWEYCVVDRCHPSTCFCSAMHCLPVSNRTMLCAAFAFFALHDFRLVLFARSFVSVLSFNYITISWLIRLPYCLPVDCDVIPLTNS